jgi:hypothetical protein
MKLKRPSWPTVGRTVMLGLSVATEVLELLRAIRGGVM